MIFIFMHADFIGLIYLMIYVGAIAVLFIFVIMMLNIRKLEHDNTTYLVAGSVIFILFLLQAIYVLSTHYIVYEVVNISFDNTLAYNALRNRDEFATLSVVQHIGILVFTQYNNALIISGLILLVALIGSVYITNNKSGYSMRRQDNQLSRNHNLFNIHVY